MTFAKQIIDSGALGRVFHYRAEFLQDWTIRSLVGRYSELIAFPIRMRDEGEDKDAAKTETINHASALWTRPKAELKDEDYQAFYKSLSHDFNEALAWFRQHVPA